MNPVLQKNKELSAILEISRVLTSSFDLEKNLATVMQILATHLEMQRGCVFLLDPLTKEIGIVAAHGLSRTAVLKGKYRIGEGIVGRVMKTGASILIPNIGDEPKFLNKTESRPQKSGISFLCIPIAIDNTVLGVISVDRFYKAKSGNVDDDLRVLNIVASLIGQFVRLWENFKITENECGTLRSQLMEKYSLPNIVGESTALQQVLKSVRKVATTDTTVLLLGESGTGKELIAQTLHYQSHRSKAPFVPVNLAALPANLIEGELFGVEKGAYTGATARRIGRFETAHNGTLFLDEIGELPLSLQVKLLRALQEKTFERIGSSQPITVKTRVVAATNRHLLHEVRKGRFREDLYWRLNVVPIVLPPLRERLSDVDLLLDHFRRKFNVEHNRKVKFCKEVVSSLSNYHWPGNVRELANLVERLIIMAESDRLGIEALPSNITEAEEKRSVPLPTADDYSNSLGIEVENLERQRIIRALQESNWVQQRASKALGITPRQLGYRIKKYSISTKPL